MAQLEISLCVNFVEYCNGVKKITNCVLVYGKHFLLFESEKFNIKGDNFFY